MGSPDSLGIGLLVGRVVIGLLMAAHGAQKLFGWFGGYGLKGTGQFMVQLGFQRGTMFAAAAGTGELVSGLLIALGFLGPIGPAMMISVMLVAAITVHIKNGVWASAGGIEINLLYAVAAFVFAFSGYGAYSIDALLGYANGWSTSLTWTVLAIGIAGAIANLAIRRHTPAVTS